MYLLNDNEYLQHYGIKNQKWGERRFQNKDGSLTPVGKQRYYNGNYTTNRYAGVGDLSDDEKERFDYERRQNEDKIRKYELEIGPAKDAERKAKERYQSLPDAELGTPLGRANLSDLEKAEVRREQLEVGKRKAEAKARTVDRNAHILAATNSQINENKNKTTLKKEVQKSGEEFIDNWVTGMKSIKNTLSKPVFGKKTTVTELPKRTNVR